jgi:hypothetical protein
MQSADPPADALAAVFAALPAGRGRQMLDTALASGIEAVADPPAALVDFFAQIDATPPWVDWNRIDRGGALFLRSGVTGLAVLNLACLPMMYASPSGNKPLVFTGQMLRRAPRRLAETARFMLESSRPGGLRRGAAGYDLTIKVRLMHAQVRRLLRQSGRWDAAWGEPINQLYMAATGITLSAVFLRGLRRLGTRVHPRDAEALLALWRYSGHLMGIAPELLCSTEDEGWHIIEFMQKFEGPPDTDSHGLMSAVMNASYLPELERYAWRVPMAYDLSRELVGHAAADGLGYPPPQGWGWLRRAAWPVLTVADLLERLRPGGAACAARRGTAQTERLIARILAGTRADLRGPAARRGAAASAEAR